MVPGALNPRENYESRIFLPIFDVLSRFMAVLLSFSIESTLIECALAIELTVDFTQCGSSSKLTAFLM